MSRSKLLVSVRSVAEAEAALAGGADLIDVKEPSRGPLGAADDAVVRNVIHTLDGQVPVSAALGEWNDWAWNEIPQGLSYVKWGLANTLEFVESWWDQNNPLACIYQMDLPSEPVLVAYADHLRSLCADPEWLAERAVSLSFRAFLIDTAVKDGTTLLDWIAPAALARIRFRLADAGVPVAFAGSLDEVTIRELLPLAPDWFAVRAAACDGGRTGAVSANRVRRLKSLIETGAAAD